MTDEPNSCVIRLFCPEQMELIILSFVLCIFTNKLLFVEYVKGGVFFFKKKTGDCFCISSWLRNSILTCMCCKARPGIGHKLSSKARFKTKRRKELAQTKKNKKNGLKRNKKNWPKQKERKTGLNRKRKQLA